MCLLKIINKFIDIFRKKKRQRGRIELLSITRPLDLKSKLSTSPTHPDK